MLEDAEKKGLITPGKVSPLVKHFIAQQNDNSMERTLSARKI
jgi:hypothetical protein